MESGTFVALVLGTAITILFLLVLFSQLGINFRPAPSTPGRPIVIESMNNRVCADPFTSPADKHSMCALFDKSDCLMRPCCGWVTDSQGGTCVHGDSRKPYYHSYINDKTNYIASPN